MDQAEATWLATVIEKKAFTWILVRGVDYNLLTRRYEITCVYKRTQAFSSWMKLSIRSPRQWVDVLSHHENGLELP